MNISERSFERSEMWVCMDDIGMGGNVWGRGGMKSEAGK